MILLAGGVAKNYQPSISVILRAISSHVIAIDALSNVPETVSQQKRAGTIVFAKSEEPWEEFKTYIDNAKDAPPVLAFYLPAKLGLAHYLSMGLSPDEAAFAWMTTTKSLLDFARKYRKHVFLVNADATLNFPEEFIEICVNKYRFNGTEKLEEFSKVNGAGDIHGILSNQIIKQNQDVRKLQQELEARSNPISPYAPPDVFDLKSVFEQLNASSEEYKKEKAQLEELKARDAENAVQLKALQTQSVTLVGENRTLEQSKTLLLEQLEVVQTEFSKSREKFEETQLAVQKKLETSQAELETSKSKNKDLDIENKNLEESNALLLEQLEVIQTELTVSREAFEETQSLLLEQLDVVQTELSAAHANPDGKLLEKKNTSLKSDLSALKKEHELVLKKGKALKAEVDALESKAKYSAQKDALMNEQMQSLQSDTQNTYFNYLQATNELEELKKVMKWKEGKTKGMLAELENDLARTHKRIDNLQNSFSWKITRPVRVISRAIGIAGRRGVKEDLQIVEESGLFDREWYLKTYPDLANIAMSPIEHFVKYGAYEGRSPGPNFNTRNYTQKHAAVLIDGENPLLHYLKSKNGN